MRSSSSRTSSYGDRRTSARGQLVSDKRGGFRPLRRCRRAGCVEATTVSACTKCWRLLSERTRGDITRASSRLTTDPKDAHARECFAAAWCAADKEWSACL
jgi:hypothetical protein